MTTSIQKNSKWFCLVAMLLIVFGLFLSAGTSVSAAEQIKKVSDSSNLPVKKLSEEDINSLVNELSKNYPTLSKEYLREGIYKQLAGDYSLNPQGVMHELDGKA